MKIFLVILFAILAFLIILTLIPFRLIAEYKKNEEENTVSLKIKYGFLRFTILPKDKTKPKKPKKEKPKKPKEPSSFEDKKKKIEKYYHIFNEIKEDVINVLADMSQKGIVFEDVGIESRFGFSDAMNTGIFTGIYNGFVYCLLGVIHQNSVLKKMDVKLEPEFNKPCFTVKTWCILRIKLSHTILVGFKVLKMLRKIKKIEGRR